MSCVLLYGRIYYKQSQQGTCERNERNESEERLILAFCQALQRESTFDQSQLSHHYLEKHRKNLSQSFIHFYSGKQGEFLSIPRKRLYERDIFNPISIPCNCAMKVFPYRVKTKERNQAQYDIMQSD